MKIQILDEAEHDLVDGCRFYESQGLESAAIFLILFSLTSTPYGFTQAFIPCISAITGFFPNASLSPCTTTSKTMSSAFMPSWIAGGIHLGFATVEADPRTSASSRRRANGAKKYGRDGSATDTHRWAAVDR